MMRKVGWNAAVVVGLAAVAAGASYGDDEKKILPGPIDSLSDVQDTAKMLFKIAEFYEQEVNNAVDALSSLLEPFIMVIIGVLVGSMVIGMYLPIFKLAAVVG